MTDRPALDLFLAGVDLLLADQPAPKEEAADDEADEPGDIE